MTLRSDLSDVRRSTVYQSIPLNEAEAEADAEMQAKQLQQRCKSISLRASDLMRQSNVQPDVEGKCVARPSRWVRGNPMANFASQLLAGFGMLSFVLHAWYSMYVMRMWEQLEVSENMMAAICFAIIGVALPCMARRVVEHPAILMLCSMVVRGQGDDKTGEMPEHLDDSPLLRVSKKLFPALVALGLLPAVLVWAPEVVLLAKLETSNLTVMVSGGSFVACSLMLWAWGMLVIGSSRVEEIGLQFVEEVVGACIANVMRPDASWSEKLKSVRELDDVLMNVFSFSAIGGLWVCRLLVLFSMCLVLSGVSAVHPRVAMRISSLVCAIVSGLFAAMLLLRLANVTKRCCGTDPDSESLFVALHVDSDVLRSREHPPSEPQIITCLTLQSFVSQRKIGIRLLGVLITRELVFTTTLRACVYLPVAVSATGALLRGSQSNEQR